MKSGTEMVDVRFECTQCGACCSQPDIIVTLTGRDIARIASGLRLSPEQMLRAVDFYITSQDEPLPQGLQKIKQALT